MHQPTAPELEILKLLWLKQPLTARELHDELESVLGWGYSSTRKTLERMGEKGFVACETLGNKNSYKAPPGTLALFSCTLNCKSNPCSSSVCCNCAEAEKLQNSNEYSVVLRVFFIINLNYYNFR